MALDTFPQAQEQQDPTPQKKESSKQREQIENNVSGRINTILDFIHQNNSPGFWKENYGVAEKKLVVSKDSGCTINGVTFLNNETKVIDERGVITGMSVIRMGNMKLTYRKDKKDFTFELEDGINGSNEYNSLEPIVSKMEAEIKKAQKFLDTQKTDAETKAKLQKVPNGQ